MFMSIIVPIYNVENFLEKTLNSLYRQDFNNIEFLLIDDGSLDSSSNICQEYVSKDSRFSYFYKENGGLSDARNFGLKKAQGDYVMFVDGDDYIENNVISMFYNKIDGKQFDIIIGDFYKDIDGEKILYTSGLDDMTLLSGQEYLKFTIANKTIVMTAWSRLYSRQYLLDNDLIFKKNYYHEDEEFTPRTIIEAERVFITSIAFYNYLIRNNSITQKKDKTKNGQDLLSIANMNNELYYNFFKAGKIDKDLYKLLYNHNCILVFNALPMLKHKKININFLCFDLMDLRNKLKYTIYIFSNKLYLKLFQIKNKRN